MRKLSYVVRVNNHRCCGPTVASAQGLRCTDRRHRDYDRDRDYYESAGWDSMDMTVAGIADGIIAMVIVT